MTLTKVGTKFVESYLVSKILSERIPLVRWKVNMSRSHAFIATSLSMIVIAAPVQAADTISTLDQAVSTALNKHPDITLRWKDFARPKIRLLRF